MKKIAGIILILLAMAIIYIGVAGQLMLPPIITGVGFFVIAFVLLKEDA